MSYCRYQDKFLTQKILYRNQLQFIYQRLIIGYYQMDIVDVFTSSDDGQNRQRSLSDGNRDNISTDIQRSTKHTHKTKNIKKNYDSIEENGKTYHYQDDPQQYRKIRKKIQNRLSARRVRGRKENAFESLEQEVQYLRKVNSELQLVNARLQTQNKGIKQQLDFMKGLVKPQNSITKNDPIDRYLSPQTLTQNKNSSPQNSDFESPFMEDQSDWLRLPNIRNSSNSWAMLAVFTLILAVFVLPSDTTTQSPTVLFAAQSNQDRIQMAKTWTQFITRALFLVMNFLKAGFKYLIIFGYIWVVYIFCQKYMKRRKLKKV